MRRRRGGRGWGSRGGSIGRKGLGKRTKAFGKGNSIGSRKTRRSRGSSGSSKRLLPSQQQHQQEPGKASDRSECNGLHQKPDETRRLLRARLRGRLFPKRVAALSWQPVGPQCPLARISSNDNNNEKSSSSRTEEAKPQQYCVARNQRAMHWLPATL